jgi:flagellar biogenesis protein FliO
MSRSLSILPLFLGLLCLPDTVPAQQPTGSKSEKPPLSGVYDPDNPNADADGFLWGREASEKSEVKSEKPTGCPAGVTSGGPSCPLRPPEVESEKSEVKSEKSAAPGGAGCPGGVDSEQPTAINHQPSAPAHPPSTIHHSPATPYLAGHYRENEAETPAPPVKHGSLASMFFQMFGGLGIVAGLFILGSVLLKRLTAKGGLLGGRGRIWQVIEGVPLGPKRYLYVTRFVDRIYLLAATEQQVTLLGEIQDPTLVAAVESGDADFRRFLVPESLATWKNGAASQPAKEEEKESEMALPQTLVAPEPDRPATKPPRTRASKPAFSHPVTV